MIQTLTEDQIKRRVESAIDTLDRQLMDHSITRAIYERAIVVVDKWSCRQYQQTKNAAKAVQP